MSEKQEQPDLTVRFHCLPPPTDDDVEQLDARIVRRTARVLGCRDAALVADPELDPLAHAVAEAVQPPTLTEPATDPRRARRRCAFLDGFSLHADTAVAPADSTARERLARYLLRPAIAADRVAVRPDGRVEYRFPRPDPTGAGLDLALCAVPGGSKALSGSGSRSQRSSASMT